MVICFDLEFEEIFSGFYELFDVVYGIFNLKWILYFEFDSCMFLEMV